MRISLRTFIIAAICFASRAGAMTLHECLIYAREHAHTNVVATLEMEEARLEARISASSLMPSLSLATSGNMSFGRNIDPETNTYDNKKTLSQSFGLQISLPLFDGLVSINNLKAARAAKRQRTDAAAESRDIISLNVIRAFYNVSYCRAMVTQMEEQLERDLRNLAATQRGETLGTRSGADTAEMRAMVAADEYELANQRSLLAKAYLTLRSEMGMTLSAEPMELEEDSVAAPVPGADEAFVHPRVAQAQWAVTEGRYQLRAARGAFSPRIYLSAGVSTSYYRMVGAEVVAPDFSRQWHDNMGQYVGFSVTIPIFTGLSNVNRVKRASVELRRRKVLLEKAIYDTAREDAEAALDLANAETELVSARARLEAETVAFNAVQRKFELGAVSAIDLYTASARLATARADMEGKRIQRIINGIVADYYRGVPLIRQ